MRLFCFFLVVLSLSPSFATQVPQHPSNFALTYNSSPVWSWAEYKVRLADAYLKTLQESGLLASVNQVRKAMVEQIASDRVAPFRELWEKTQISAIYFKDLWRTRSRIQGAPFLAEHEEIILQLATNAYERNLADYALGTIEGYLRPVSDNAGNVWRVRPAQIIEMVYSIKAEDPFLRRKHPRRRLPASVLQSFDRAYFTARPHAVQIGLEPHLKTDGSFYYDFFLVAHFQNGAFAVHSHPQLSGVLNSYLAPTHSEDFRRETPENTDREIDRRAQSLLLP